jgi:ComF family protein
MNRQFSPFAARLLALLLPERCRVCREPSSAALCPSCHGAVTYCNDDDAGGEAKDLPCRSLCLYEEPVAGLIHRLKYAADRTVLPALAEITAVCDLADCAAADLIVPVPLHVSRLRRRGLNQSLLLARLFFPGRRQAIRGDLLVRHRPTTPQTGLSGEARRRNLQNAFSLAPASGAIAGRHLLLVDDVRTTGSTLAECRRILLAGGAARVSCLTLARADLPPLSSFSGKEK